MRILSIASMLWAAISLACAGNPSQPSQVPLGQSFQLRAGASAILPDGFEVTFTGANSDSRCPSDLACPWAGDATVSLRLSQPPGSQAERELHTNANASETSYLAHTIRLVTLAPYPRSDRHIQPNEYVATLTVTAQ